MYITYSRFVRENTQHQSISLPNESELLNKHDSIDECVQILAPFNIPFIETTLITHSFYAWNNLTIDQLIGCNNVNV